MKTKFAYHTIQNIARILLFLFLSACNNPLNQAGSSAPTPTQVIGITASTFGIGDLASISSKDVSHFSSEEIIKLLITQWLETFKKQPRTDAIKDFKVGKITLKGSSADYEIISAVIFSIEPINFSPNWVSFGGGEVVPNDPWLDDGAIFGVVRDGDFYKLRLLPGWGT